VTTSTVNGQLVNASGGELSGATVTLTLVDLNDNPAIGFDAADGFETIDAVTVTPSATGAWTAALVPNASLQTAIPGQTTAYRVVESSAGASSTYWIIVTAVSPSWVGDLRTTEVGPAQPGSLPGTWCTVTDVLTYANAQVTQQDVNVAQVLIEAIVRRVWRVTDVQKRDYYWLMRATAWQARYVAAHPEVLDMMDVQSLSQDGLSITFKSASGQMLALYSPVAVRYLNNLFRGSNSTIRYNSAFQKNRPPRGSLSAGASVPWRSI
jgi:hypothetical protein